MRYSLSLCALVAPVMVFAAPARYIPKRAMAAKMNLDATVLKFANVLEQAESTFYQLALAKFKDQDFVDAGFPSAEFASQQFKNIQTDEATHSGALVSALKALGEEPISGCQFNFDGALTDVATMAATARAVENLGVAAYLGAAPLVTDPVILDAAGSILTIEARHSTVLNILSGSGTAVPQAFDIPLTPSEILAVAGPLISGCDTGIPANTPLTITTSGQVGPGTKLSFKADSIKDDTSNLFCQMIVGGGPAGISLPFDNCVVPDGINGPVAIFITNDGTPLINNVRDRNAKQVVAGPALTFIDIKSELLGQMARTGQKAASSSSNSDSSNSDSGNSGDNSAASGTSGAEGSAQTSSSNSGPVNGSSSGPSLATGPTANGDLEVNGWNFPNGQPPSS